MPCPYFEPQRVVISPRYANARLPLIHEYQGVCHAAAEPQTAPEALRFQYCNHGYSRGACDCFPSIETRSCLRYTVVRRTATALELVCVEEQDHAPLRWQTLRYILTTGELDPEVSEICMRTQALAFCRSYLQQFSA